MSIVMLLSSRKTNHDSFERLIAVFCFIGVFIWIVKTTINAVRSWTNTREDQRIDLSAMSPSSSSSYLKSDWWRKTSDAFFLCVCVNKTTYAASINGSRREKEKRQVGLLSWSMWYRKTFFTMGIFFLTDAMHRQIERHRGKKRRGNYSPSLVEWRHTSLFEKITDETNGFFT
jgi:hypothetical protein